MLIVDGEVDGRAGTDLRVVGGVIAELGVGLARRAGEEVLDAAGGAVIPALWDHHVHLRASAAARTSAAVGPPVVTGRRGFEEALCRAAGRCQPGGWIRAVGYHESVAGPLDRARLDAVVADRPVRVQHRSGALWVLNGAAVAAAGVDRLDDPGVERGPDGTPTGRLWRLDRWLATVAPPPPLDLAAVSRDAARLGVAGFTDADPERTADDVGWVAAAVAAGELVQRAVLMSATGTAAGAGPAGTVVAGPRKVLLDDTTLPPVDELAGRFAAAHAAGEPVAVHCVTRLQLVATLAALDQAGSHAGDRVEHAAVVPPELRADLRRLGVTAVTQPHFVAERGDRYLEEVDADDVPLLYPCRSLRDAGVPVAAGTDAPFGGADPWASMRAATTRRTAAGTVLGPDERVDARVALGLFLGWPDAPAVERRVAAGAPADLCLLAAPLDRVLATLASDSVAVTLVGGRVVADQR